MRKKSRRHILCLIEEGTESTGQPFSLKKTLSSFSFKVGKKRATAQIGMVHPRRQSPPKPLRRGEREGRGSPDLLTSPGKTCYVLSPVQFLGAQRDAARPLAPAGIRLSTVTLPTSPSRTVSVGGFDAATVTFCAAALLAAGLDLPDLPFGNGRRRAEGLGAVTGGAEAQRDAARPLSPEESGLVTVTFTGVGSRTVRLPTASVDASSFLGVGAHRDEASPLSEAARGLITVTATGVGSRMLPSEADTNSCLGPCGAQREEESPLLFEEEDIVEDLQRLT